MARLLLSAAPLALVAALPAAAQERADPQPAAAETAASNADVVVTAQRRNETQVIRGGEAGILGDKDAADIPFSIRGYNAALILNQQPQTLGQVLDNDPSIRTTYGFGNAAEQFVIRGFPLYGDDVGFDSLYGIAPRQLVAPELFEQVQVLNGASAFLNGAAPGGSSIGGSVNLIPKRAGRDPLTRVTAAFSSGANFGGSADVARRFGADGRWGVRVNGAYRAGDVGIDDEFRRNAVAGASIDYRGEAVRVTIDAAYQRVQVRRLRPKVTVTTAIPAVADAAQNYGQPFTYTTLRDVFGQARIEWDVAPNAMLYAQAGARDGSEDGIYGGITVNNAVTGAATGTALYVPRTDNNEAVQSGLRVKLAAGGITQEINFGGNASWQVNRNAYDFRYGPGFAGYATNLYATPAVALPSSALVGGDLAHPFPVSRTALLSAFGSDTVGLLGDRVLVTGGLRIQQLNLKSYSYATGALSTRYNKSAITPVAGVVVKPVTGLSLFFNRIEALQQGPTAPATGLNTVTNTTQPVYNLGTVFPPYRSVQYETGAKLTVGPVNASVALYAIRLPVGQVAPDPAHPGFVVYGLYGNQRNRGIELSVDGEIARGLRVIAGGTIVDATLRDRPGGVGNGNDAPGVPDYTANANVEWDLPFARGLTVTGRLVQTGAQKVNVANTLAIPAWTRVDLGARYVTAIGGRAATLRAGVDNVANNRYWASAFDTFSQTLLQGAPRTYKASLSFDF